MQPPRSYKVLYKNLPNPKQPYSIVAYIIKYMLKHKVCGRSYPVKHRYQTWGVVGGACKLFYIVSLK